MREPTMRLGMCLAVAVLGWGGGALVSMGGCATARTKSTEKFKPTSEAELAARRLQEALDKHQCKAAVYPSAEPDWRVVRVQSLAGRGASFQTALEALCREADGKKLQAIVDIYYWRTPSGWSPSHELRGTAVRYEEGFTPPPPPAFADVRPPEMARSSDDEPAPAGEGGKK